MTQYKLTQNPDQIIRLSDGAIIPNLPNGDWQLYQKWIADGGVPIAADPLPTPSPNWSGLYSRLLGGDLDPIFASLKTAAKLSTATNWNLTQITFAITETKIEQALKTCLDELKEGGYVFTTAHKTLWNNAIAELNFSPLVKL